MNYAERQVADIAASLPGATQVFRHYKIDFCCGGQVPLSQAAAERGAALPELEAELAALETGATEVPKGNEELIEHILDRYHATHRAELPELVRLAARVEERHADKPAVPRGLHAALLELSGALEDHMQKEEQVLFPMLVAGHGARAGMPISVIEAEHEDHGKNLARLRALVSDYVPPAEACNTWKALYLGLAELERELMEHIHLENNALFPRALNG